MKETKFLAWPDTHVPDQNEDAVECALKILKWYKPDTLIILGDFLDCAPVSHWLKDKHKTTEGMRLANDYADGRKLLKRMLVPSVKELVYLEGNHEDWIRQALERNKEFEGMIELEVGLDFKGLRKKGLKIKQYKYGECHKLGHLYFTHGTYACVHHAKKHVEEFGRSIVYGHIHDVQSYTKCSPVDIEEKHMGLSLGCLTNKNPEYNKRRPNKWVHAVGPGLVRADGTFNIDPVIISAGVASYAGRTFKA